MRRIKSSSCTKAVSRVAAVNRMQRPLDLLGEDHGAIPAEGGSFNELPYSVAKVKKDFGFPLSQFETNEVTAAIEANDYTIAASAVDAAASYIASFPTLTANFSPGGVGTSTSYGGNEMAAIPRAVGMGLHIKAEAVRWSSENAARLALFERQTHERILAANTVGQEIMGIDVHIAAQKLRVEQAALQLRMEEHSLEQDAEMDTFLRAKYTNTELYTWSLNSMQSVYYNTVQSRVGYCRAGGTGLQLREGQEPSRPRVYHQRLLEFQSRWALRRREAEPGSAAAAEGAHGGARARL